jgi:cell division cycle protein 20 (cofactor of APC complex)
MQGDMFIPDRSAMDLAHYLLTETKKDMASVPAMAASPSKEAYERLLMEKLLNNRTWILAFRNKPPEPENVFAVDTVSSYQAKLAKQMRYIPQVCKYFWLY